MTFRKEVEECERQSALKTAARNILKGVEKWRERKNIASKRWIWELIQNAVDCGIRDEKSIKVRVRFDGKTLQFEHTGGCFLPDELGALITGGSTKPYGRPSEYTGRFGSGFLVTHILSLIVDVEGIGKSSSGDKFFKFKLTLDRSGKNEDEILNKIDESHKQLDCAVELDKEPEEVISRFTYHIADEDYVSNMLIDLINLLKEEIPFVMLLKGETLREVHIDMVTHNKQYKWTCISVSDEVWNGLFVRKAIVEYEERVENSLSSKITIEVIGFKPEEDCNVMCSIAVKHEDCGKEVIDVSHIPKIFAPYPLIGASEDLGLRVVICADKLEVTEDRNFIKMEGKPGEENKSKMEKLIGIIPKIVRYAIDKGWRGAHRLALITRTPETLPGYGWWNEQLRKIVEHLINMCIVKTADGKLLKPCDENLWFLLPLIRKYEEYGDIPADYADFDQEHFLTFWEIDSEVYKLPEVDKDIAYEWQYIVRNWLKLLDDTDESKPQLWTLEDFCNQIKEEGQQLNLKKQHLQSLIKILDLSLIHI